MFMYLGFSFILRSSHADVYKRQAPHRENLAVIRKGEFEGMKEKIHQPEWHPDFGPAERHPTAGTVVEFLPKEPLRTGITGDDAPSPAARYQSIVDKLFPDGVK